MADPSIDLSQPTDWAAIGEQLAEGLLTRLAASNIGDALSTTLTQHVGETKALAWRAAIWVAATLGDVLVKLEEPGAAAIAPFVAPSLAALFGANVDAGLFTRRLQAGDAHGAAESIASGFMQAITGSAGAGGAEPGYDGSKRLATAAVQASLESTFNAALIEVLSDIVPDVGHFTALTEIPESVIRALGVGRLVRQALRPIVNATCAVPATWAANKQYRPKLLGAAEIARQIAREKMSQEDGAELLARDGYNDAAIDALINAAGKFLSAADLYLLIRAKEWSESDAVTHLQDSGYDAPLATTLLTIEQLKLIATFDEELATAAVDAFAAGRIDEGTLGGFVHGTTFTDQHSAQKTELAHAKRVLGARPLTAAEAEACVLAGIANYADYRDALARENRTDDAILTLELLLRTKVDAKTAAADHKKQQAADVAAAKQAKLDAAAAKKTAHEQAVALAQRGKPAQLEAAYLRGLIPITRVQEVWAPLYDADTVATLSAALEDKRAAIVAQQDAAAKAKARAAQKQIPITQLEAAVKDGTLTLAQYRDRLTALGFDAADVEVMAGSLGATVAAAAAAKQAHADAVAQAKVKHIDLATLELLVRRGHRSMSDFTRTLASLGYDAGAVAALQDKLQLEIDADAAAAQVKAAAAARAAAKGLNLAQAERAVVLGVQPLDWFQSWLLKSGEDAVAQQTIAASVKAEADQAQAARARRAAADARRDARAIPVADLAKAARLNVIPVATYTAALSARGYSADDIALETDLLTTEIANAVAAQQKHADAVAAAKAKHLNLGQLDAAVIAGALTIDAYIQRVISLGFSPDDAALVASVVSDKAAVAKAAAAKRAQIASGLAAKHLSLATLETGVLDGLLSMADFSTRLTDQGFAPEDVALVAGILQQRAATLSAAKTRAAQLASGDPGKETTRAAFEKSVTDGLRSLDDYQRFLVEQGYGDDDVQLYLALEQFTLDKAAAKAHPVTGP